MILAALVCGGALALAWCRVSGHGPFERRENTIQEIEKADAGAVRATTDPSSIPKETA